MDDEPLLPEGLFELADKGTLFFDEIGTQAVRSLSPGSARTSRVTRCPTNASSVPFTRAGP